MKWRDTFTNWARAHSPADSFSPSILQGRVRISSKPLMLFKNVTEASIRHWFVKITKKVKIKREHSWSKFEKMILQRYRSNRSRWNAFRRIDQTFPLSMSFTMSTGTKFVHFGNNSKLYLIIIRWNANRRIDLTLYDSFCCWRQIQNDDKTTTDKIDHFPYHRIPIEICHFVAALIPGNSCDPLNRHFSATLFQLDVNWFTYSVTRFGKIFGAFIWYLA